MPVFARTSSGCSAATDSHPPERLTNQERPGKIRCPWRSLTMHLGTTLALLAPNLVACVDQGEEVSTSAITDDVQILTSCRSSTGPYQPQYGYYYNAILSAPTAAEGTSKTDSYSRNPQATACPTENTFVKVILGTAPHPIYRNSIEVSTDWRYGGGNVPTNDQMTKAMCENSTLTVWITELFASGSPQVVSSFTEHGTWAYFVYPNTGQPSHWGCDPTYVTYDAGPAGGTFEVSAQVVRGAPQSHHGYGNVSFQIENYEQ